MTVLSPILGGALALLLLAGSPSFGYILIRFAFPFTSNWLGWKRALVAGVVGLVWSAMLIVVLLPALQGEMISSQSIGEWAWWGGLGILIIALITRGAVFVSLRGLSHPAMMENAVANATNYSPSKKFQSEESVAVYKPSQIRPSMVKQTPQSQMEEPILENDVLDLLKEEAPEQAPTEREEQLSAQPQMVEFGTSENFEDTLEQLKKDLKDFNESMNKKPSKKGDHRNE